MCRDAPGGKGLSRVDSLALKASAASITRMHDTGRTVDPNRDISHHYRPHRGYSGSHHGAGLYAAEVGGSLHNNQAGDSMHRKKGLPRNRSEGALTRTRSGAARNGPQVLCLLVVCTQADTRSDVCVYTLHAGLYRHV